MFTWGWVVKTSVSNTCCIATLVIPFRLASLVLYFLVFISHLSSIQYYFSQCIFRLLQYFSLYWFCFSVIHQLASTTFCHFIKHCTQLVTNSYTCDYAIISTSILFLKLKAHFYSKVVSLWRTPLIKIFLSTIYT